MSTDGPVPDSGMMTGSDAGEPGEHLPGPELTDDERALLDTLSEPTVPVVEAVEDGDSVVRAAEDDAPLPGAATADEPGADPLDPPFVPPAD